MSTLSKLYLATTAGAAVALLLPTTLFAQASEPVKGGIVRFAIAEESRGMDPSTSHRRFSETAMHVHDTLVVMDTSGNPYGALAESWEVNEDATEYTIRLKQGVVFHDGTPMTANSVKAHFDRVFENCCSNATQYMAGFTTAEVLDDHTVVVRFERPTGTFSHYIGMQDVTAIPSEAAWEQKGKEMNQSPVGAGPFKFVEWVPQSHISYERFDAYNWGSDLFENQAAPHLDGVEVRFIADQSTRTACLMAGDCDIIRDPSFQAQVQLSQDDEFELVKIPETGMPFSFVFNTKRWPTDDVAVRKAINFAVDREKINQAAYLGQRQPLYSTLAPATPEFWEGAPDLISFDPDAAAAMLEEAGYVDSDGDGIRERDGQQLAIDLFIFGNREGNPSVIVAESMQADLSAIGVGVNINVRPWDDQSVVAMNGDHHLINFNMPLPTASVLGVMFHSDETPEPGKYGMGFTYFGESTPSLSQQLDALLEAGDNAATFEERKSHLVEAQKIIGENYLGLPISSGYAVYAMTKNL